MTVEVYPNIYNVDVYESVVYVPAALTLVYTSEDISGSSNRAYVVDTASGPVSVLLPLNPKQGDTVEAVRYGANIATLSRNGHNVNGSAQDLSLIDQESARLRYVNSAIGWIRF